ncbi:hypothetical protein DL764_010228 [Monosporascus ibericus]|uniref:Uncharacterized protein n=1 Tax=Monosporascus ibericus TaxID=155417 RepID=A0A4Q4ST25_9PEZI|nr:hypothetical protein DL764_010228 [Monosporascus ibericus]
MRDVIFNEMEFFNRKDTLERWEEMIRNLEDLVAKPDQQVKEEVEDSRCEDDLRVLHEEERFYSFREYKVASSWMGAFTAGRKFSLHRKDLAEPPKNVRELENHPMKQQFRAAQKAHLKEHDSFRSWEE